MICLNTKKTPSVIPGETWGCQNLALPHISKFMFEFTRRQSKVKFSDRVDLSRREDERNCACRDGALPAYTEPHAPMYLLGR